MKFDDSRWNLGFGTYQLRGEVCTQAVYHALELGHRLIDTATLYRNHAAVGQGIALAIEKGICTRQDVCVVTKVDNKTQAAGDAAIRDSMVTEVRNLGLEYVDVILLHGYIEGAWEKAWVCLQELRETGLCRHIGVSNYYAKQLRQLLESPVCQVRPLLNQIEVSPFHDPQETIAYCEDQGVVVQAHTPLIKGHKHEDARVVAAWKCSTFPSISYMLLAWCLYHRKLPLVVRTSSSEHRVENWSVATCDATKSNAHTATFALLDSIEHVYVTHVRVGTLLVGIDTE